MHGLAIATDSLPTKFEVSISTHYEDMKDDTKCRQWDGLGYLASLKVTENSTNQQSTYEFQLAFLFYSNYVPILHSL